MTALSLIFSSRVNRGAAAALKVSVGNPGLEHFAVNLRTAAAQFREAFDGEIVRGCLMLAVQCDGAKVETIEGLSDSGEVADLQAAFEQRNALQCGFCTPGMLAAAQDLLKRAKKVPSRDEIREHLSGNYCRCTGYHAIIDAVEAVAQGRAKGR